ncbi:helix-turn-helix domain-containing protein [Streptomyces calidiresistens]
MARNGLPGQGEDGSGPTLEKLLSVMGAGALEVCVAPAGRESVVEGVTVLDPLDPGPSPGHLVLAVGIDPHSAAAVDVVRDVAASGTVAVVFGPGRTGRPGRTPDALRIAAEETGIALLFRTAWFDWSRLVGALRAGLVLSGAPADPSLAAVPPGDLNGLADTVSSLVGGAVTIEDVESRVLAYSSTGEDVDELRRLTILGRRVPEWRIAAMREAGFFRTLWSTGEVIHRPAHGENPERLVVAVRAGGEALGSIWVAATGTPFAPHASDALRSAARVAAVHLVHHRSYPSHARLVEDAARALLDGRGSATVLAERAELPVRGHCAVMAVRPGTPDRGDGTGQLRGLLAVHCGARGHRAVVLPVDGGALVLLGALHENGQRAVDQVSRLGESLIRQVTAAFGPGAGIGLGPVVEGLAELPGSHRSAEEALRALMTPGEERGVAFASAVAERVALNRITDALTGLDLPPETPVARLVAFDAGPGGGTMVRTLRAYLDHFGHVPATARALGVHANSLRHRIVRLTEVSGLDLHDPEARLLAHLQLRLLDGDGDGGGAVTRRRT